MLDAALYSGSGPGPDTREAGLQRLQEARSRWEKALAQARSCPRCKRRHGEAVIGFADGSWFSSKDGYHRPTGARLTGEEGQREADRLLKETRQGRSALVVVRLDKAGLCERCQELKRREA